MLWDFPRIRRENYVLIILEKLMSIISVEMQNK
jgi:hypothetical protein